jgi:hypothetical protein
MNFVEKLIEETKNGNLDFVWKYSNANYKFSYPKHPMNDMFFTYIEDEKRFAKLTDITMVFPNGAGIRFDKNQIKALALEVDMALLRANDVIVNDYLSGAIDKEVAQVTAEAQTKTEKVPKTTEKSNVVANPKKEIPVKKETKSSKGKIK